VEHPPGREGVVTRVLVIDVGGTNLKIAGTAHRTPVKVPSGPRMTVRKMVEAVREATRGWAYDAVSIGYPGPVVDGRPAAEPRNLARGWVKFDYRRAFGRPVKIVNDAAMQALGAYRGGRLLFLGLGTGLGSALVVDGHLVPLELAHLPYRNGRTFEDYVGARGRKRMGRKRWRKHVEQVVAILRHALQAKHVVLGGGEAKDLRSLPEGARLGTNVHAVAGGLRLWEASRGPAAHTGL
jgi:polyphosphate glucokinase